MSIKAFTISSLFIVSLAVLFYYQQKEFDPVVYSLDPPPALEGPLAVNTKLRNAQLLLKGKLSGPESLVIEGNSIYTGTWDGKLLRIVDGTIQKSIRIRPGKKTHTCGTFDTEPKCGRPLGIRRFNSDEFIVADAYSGLYMVNFDEETVKQVFSAEKVLDGAGCAFVNDLDVLDNKTVIFSDSSTKWDRRHFLHDFLEGKRNGRVVSLDLNSGKAEVIVSGVGFANGIQIHPDRISVLISECSKARIIRYFFDGPKKGMQETFANNLPGFPDNIRLSFSGESFLVGLAAVRHSQSLLPFLDLLGPHPWIRWAIVQLIPERYLALIFTKIGKKHGFVLEIDLNGKFIRSYQDPNGEVISDVSQVSDDKDWLYLGSFHADYIGRVSKKGY